MTNRYYAFSKCQTRWEGGGIYYEIYTSTRAGEAVGDDHDGKNHKCDDGDNNDDAYDDEIGGGFHHANRTPERAPKGK